MRFSSGRAQLALAGRFLKVLVPPGFAEAGDAKGRDSTFISTPSTSPFRLGDVMTAILERDCPKVVAEGTGRAGCGRRLVCG